MQETRTCIKFLVQLFSCSFPSLYPTLEVDYVAKEIVTGTLRDEPLVVIPRAVVLNYALAG